MSKPKQAIVQSDRNYDDAVAVHTTESVEAAQQDIPSRYRLTEAGVIPQDWGVTAVGAEFTIELGKMLDAAKNIGDLKPYIGNRAVQWGRINVEDIAKVRMTRRDLQRYRLRSGDLLVCEGGEIGRSAIWHDQIPECYFQKALHRLRPTGEYNVYFMMSLLQMWAATGGLANFVTQTSIAHLPKVKLKQIPLPFPTTAEQEIIGTALSDADALIESLDRLIAKKRAIKQAAMQQLLTGQTRLPGFKKKTGFQETGSGTIPNDWTSAKLGACLADSPKYGINAPAVAYSDSLPSYIRITDISEDGRFKPDKPVSVSHEASDRYYLEEGDIVFARTGASVGKSYVYDENDGELVFAGFLIRIRPDKSKLDPSYLGYYVMTARYWDWVALMSMRTGQPGINAIQYYQMDIPLPSVREQSAIAAVLSDMDAEIEALERRRGKSKDIKQGMMQQLLTGRVRLVEPEIAA